MKKSKKILIIIIAFCFLAFPVFATNTHTADLTRSSSQHFSRADDNGLDFNSDFTLMAWINFDSLPSDNSDHQQIINKLNADVTTGGYYLRVSNTDKPYCVYAKTGQFTGWIADNAITDTGWQHIACSCDISAQTCELYLNGSGIAESSAITGATSIGDDGDEFYIGARGRTAGTDDYFDGQIDDVRIYTDILTSTEISDHYNCKLTGAGGEPDNLLDNWLFDNNANGTEGNNLTAVNGATYQSGSMPYSDDCGAAAPAEEVKQIKIPPQIIIN